MLCKSAIDHCASDCPLRQSRSSQPQVMSDRYAQLPAADISSGLPSAPGREHVFTRGKSCRLAPLGLNGWLVSGCCPCQQVRPTAVSAEDLPQVPLCNRNYSRSRFLKGRNAKSQPNGGWLLHGSISLLRNFRSISLPNGKFTPPRTLRIVRLDNKSWTRSLDSNHLICNCGHYVSVADGANLV